MENRVRADEVALISLADIREGGPEQVRDKLLALPTGAVCAVDSVTHGRSAGAGARPA